MKRNVLVVVWGLVGEVLLATPLLACLRAGLPKARISVILLKSRHRFFRQAGSMLERNPHIDSWQYSDRVDIKGLLTGKPYDIVIDLCCCGFLRRVVRLACSGMFVGGRFWEQPDFFSFAGCGAKTGDVTLAAGLSKAGAYLRMAAFLGMKRTKGFLPRLYFSPAERAAAALRVARAVGRSAETVIAMHPGGRHAYRLWPAQQYALLADELAERLHARILVVAGPGEEDDAARVLRSSRNRPALLSVSDIRSYAAAVSCCDYFISSDGGPLHIALACGVASFGLLPDLQACQYWYGLFSRSGLLTPLIVNRRISPRRAVEQAYETIRLRVERERRGRR